MTSTPADPYAGLPRRTIRVLPQERVVTGVPAAEAVVAEIELVGAQRVFVLTGRTLAGLDDGPVQRVVAALGPRHAGTSSAIAAHSPREDVVAAAVEARAAGADLLLAIGGGSVVDAGKAVLLCLWHAIESPDAMAPYGSAVPSAERLAIRPPRDAIRLMTVSTTLSASEFTSGAGVTDSATRTKQSYQHPLMVPRTVVLDPGATLPTPQWLLACTALRSVDHAVETYCSPDAGPATEAQSLHGLRLLAEALPRMWRDPDDLAPRLTAQIGMWHAISALAVGVPTGASHGIGYALGAGFGVAHGHTSCVLLPAVMRWNAETHGERQRALAEAMGDAGRPAHELVRELVRGAGQPTTLREVGLSRDDLPELARRSLGYGSLRANPRPVRDADDVLEILELAW